MKNQESDSGQQIEGFSCPGLLWLPMVLTFFLFIGLLMLLMIDLMGIAWVNIILTMIGGVGFGCLGSLPVYFCLLDLLGGSDGHRQVPDWLQIVIFVSSTFIIGIGAYFLSQSFFPGLGLPRIYQFLGAVMVLFIFAGFIDKLFSKRQKSALKKQ